MIYKFPHSKRRAKPVLEKLRTPENTSKDPTTGIIQGQVVDSKEELWVAMGLNRLVGEGGYKYQYPIMGGRARGGYLIDFVVWTVPLWTMFEVEGNHWHTGELGADDLKRKADIEDLMQDVARRPIESLWVPDLLNTQTTFQSLRKALSGN